MSWLKQSTAVTIKIGPFLDSTDGNTVEDGLTISQTDVRLSKNGGNMAQKNESTACTHDELGYYDCPLDATDTGTLGLLKVMVHKSGALAVWHDFIVLPANVYDSLVSGTDTFQADVIQIGGSAQSATDLKDFADTGYDPSTHKVAGVVLTDTCTTNTDMRGTDSASTHSAADVKTAIEAGGSSIAQILAVTDNLPNSGALTDLASAADLATTDGKVDTVLADTNELQTDLTDGGRLDLLVDAIKAKTDNLPAAPAATGDIPTAGAIADAVWDEATADHTGAGSTGAALAAAGESGDPWSTALPGSYAAGTAGKIIGDSMLGLCGAKKVVAADGLSVQIYDKSDNLLVTLTRTGSGPYTWTPVWE